MDTPPNSTVMKASVGEDSSIGHQIKRPPTKPEIESGHPESLSLQEDALLEDRDSTRRPPFESAERNQGSAIAFPHNSTANLRRIAPMWFGYDLP